MSPGFYADSLTKLQKIPIFRQIKSEYFKQNHIPNHCFIFHKLSQRPVITEIYHDKEEITDFELAH